MKTAILGSSGFIGKNLLKVLSNAHGVSLREKTWRNDFDSASVLINFVGKAHDHKMLATQEDYYHANTELAKQVYEAFVASEAILLIHVSSLAAVEEFESNVRLTESNQCHPVSWYGKSKYAAEKWLLEQKLPSNKKLIILRPPMVHGPGDKGNLGLLYKFISKGIPYPLSSFDNKRSFISIDNFCYFIEQIIEGQEKMESGIYHIADDEPISTKEIIAIMKNVTNKNVRNVALPKAFVKTIAKIGDKIPIPLNSKRLKKMTSDLLVSNEKIKNALGIEKLPLTAKEGLEKTIRSFKEK
ncbi:Nucleoside-diphosphate-sugar epimerase [Sphingobacterium nematocida]|uniref:Nucleoside-diphosphate-sugar epimerase n=1 Tax=Sphingobacterium nematocida TaxID=1513896 RepID=A0A1T5EYA7_9SPHI|nr:NAD-dependent epimerase/dehydratase family protein [Sphingobacterium nematocida]SKB88881.1 Nucleoside-diphosphate-sugar epimerase [Sphingobacterium nematocida]